MCFKGGPRQCTLQASRREREKLQVSTMRSETVTELEKPVNQCCSDQVKQENIVLYFTSSASSALEQVLEPLSTFSVNITPAQLPLLPGKCYLCKADLLLFIRGIQAQEHHRLS